MGSCTTVKMTKINHNQLSKCPGSCEASIDYTAPKQLHKIDSGSAIVFKWRNICRASYLPSSQDPPPSPFTQQSISFHSYPPAHQPSYTCLNLAYPLIFSYLFDIFKFIQRGYILDLKEILFKRVSDLLFLKNTSDHLKQLHRNLFSVLCCKHNLSNHLTQTEILYTYSFYHQKH